MDCEECGSLLRAPETSSNGVHSSIVPKAEVRIEDSRYLRLLMNTLSTIPNSGRPIQSLTTIKLRKKGSLPGLVGLTRYQMQEYRTGGRYRDAPSSRHIITFYSSLLGQLSDDSVMAVMAHEIAHAWLNEHIGPEASMRREEDADILAEMWGFSKELAALAEETEPISASSP
ncbi:MAG TPA: M48 family metalloprotease [Nitrososphaerales archaeon]|nr:M48 family metalloprotease [Nitrososphaerales archaeon]